VFPGPARRILARRSNAGTVGGMTPSSRAMSAVRPSCPHDPADRADVLGSVAVALRAADDADDWAVLEAWVLALTLVTGAALEAVPEELHDFL
jgi:hypothetical protein